MMQKCNNNESNIYFLKYAPFHINFKEIINSIIFAFIFAFGFQTFFYQPFTIPSGSMKPGLQVGDYLLVQKFAYGYNNSSLSFALNQLKFFDQSLLFNDPKRGDIIVFLLPTDKSCHYIKRLIGLPGDKIIIKEGLLYINDIVVKRQYIGQKILIDTSNAPETNSIFRETLPNGISYKIYKENNTKAYSYNFDHNNTPIYKVPKGHYFFMGDDRDNSIDSRFLNKVGYVHQNKILGKAQILFWTFDFSICDFVTELKTHRVFKQIK